MAWQEPKTDWLGSNAPTDVDLERIEGNTQYLYDTVTTGKNNIAAAITAMGQAALGSETFASLAAKIRDISDDANAGVGDVLVTKTFFQGGAKRTGTMPNRGEGGTVTPSTVSQTKQAGYYSSDITISAIQTAAGDNVAYIDDNEAYGYPGGGATAWVQTRSVTLGYGGSVRVKFQMKTDYAVEWTAYAQLFKNGIAIGPQFETTLQYYSGEFTLDIPGIVPGDIISLKQLFGSSYTTRTINFKVCIAGVVQVGKF